MSSSSTTTTSLSRAMSIGVSGQLGKLLVAGLMARSTKLVDLSISHREKYQVSGTEMSRVLSIMDNFVTYAMFACGTTCARSVVKMAYEAHSSFTDKKMSEEEKQKAISMKIVNKTLDFIKESVPVSIEHLGYALGGDVFLESPHGIGSYTFRELCALFNKEALDLYGGEVEDSDATDCRLEVCLGLMRDIWLYLSKGTADKFISLPDGSRLTFRYAKSILKDSLKATHIALKEARSSSPPGMKEKERWATTFEMRFDRLYYFASKKPSASWPVFIHIAYLTLRISYPVDEESVVEWNDSDEGVSQVIEYLDMKEASGMGEKGNRKRVENLFGNRHPLPVMKLLNSDPDLDHREAFINRAIGCDATEYDYGILTKYVTAYFGPDAKRIPSHNAIRKAILEGKSFN